MLHDTALLVCRWRALLADEPIRLRINSGRWPAILSWLPSARLPVSALELYLGDEVWTPSSDDTQLWHVVWSATKAADVPSAFVFQQQCSDSSKVHSGCSIQRY